MRSQLLLIPLAAVASMPAPAEAEVYLTVEQAQKLLFPNATFTRDFIFLSQKQREAIQDLAKAPQWSNEVKAWRVSTGGWYVVDQVQGRDDMVFLSVGISPEGAVTGIEVMVCLEEYSGVRNPAWRRQFVGLKRQFNQYKIRTISGTSLSSWNISAGVERILVIYDLLLRHRR